MATAYLGIGSNLGNRRKNINTAIEKLNSIKGIEVKRVSSIIETKPEGGEPQNKFLNGVIEIETGLSPFGLLRHLKKIEKELGRVKTARNAPRVIDLDILTFGDKNINTPRLKIPHPRMQERGFVMRPLKELLGLE